MKERKRVPFLMKHRVVWYCTEKPSWASAFLRTGVKRCQLSFQRSRAVVKVERSWKISL